MSNSFTDLIENFGVPKIVVPNTPRTLALSGAYFTVGKNPEIPPKPSDKVFYRRFQYGDADFLAVKSRIETDLSRVSELLEHLRNQNLTPIEFVYTYEEIWSSKEIVAKVAIATDQDVAPLDRAEIVRAIGEKRLIWACGWSSMGDAYLDVALCRENSLPTDEGVYFLFDTPDIPERMLVGIGEYYDRGDNVLDFCGREYFTRVF